MDREYGLPLDDPRLEYDEDGEIYFVGTIEIEVCMECDTPIDEFDDVCGHCGHPTPVWYEGVDHK